ncbi:MAG: hypothetical protein U9R53_02480 [Chloroflexota bacterium]|nr:hypothetical protein [Chloroflexota bacterium]
MAGRVSVERAVDDLRQGARYGNLLLARFGTGAGVALGSALRGVDLWVSETPKDEKKGFWLTPEQISQRVRVQSRLMCERMIISQH